MNDVEKMDYLRLIFIWEITTKMLLWYVFLKKILFLVLLDGVGEPGVRQHVVAEVAPVHVAVSP